MGIDVPVHCRGSYSRAESAGRLDSLVVGSNLAVGRTAVVVDHAGNRLELVGHTSPVVHGRHTVAVGRIVVAGRNAAVGRTAMAASTLAGRTVVEVVASRNHRTAEEQVRRIAVAAHRSLGYIDCNQTL